MTHTEALKLALETLERASDSGYSIECDEAITAIKEALAQPAPYMAVSNDRISVDPHTGNVSIGSPPQRKPLTDEEINQIADEFIVNYRIPAGSHYDFARAIEAAHNIKE